MVVVKTKNGSRYASAATGGIVTNDGWSYNDAEVVCWQIGYSTDGENWI